MMRGMGVNGMTLMKKYCETAARPTRFARRLARWLARRLARWLARRVGHTLVY